MVVHPQVTNAHLAGCAAAKQGKFQQFKTTWWEKGFKARKTDDANIDAIAKEIGLDMGKFKADKDGAECKAARRRRTERAAEVPGQLDADLVRQRHPRRWRAPEGSVQADD